MTLRTKKTTLAKSESTGARPVACELYFLPIETRVPLKFGHETLTSVICARVKLTIESKDGRRAEGWGETPLSVQWVWPSELPYQTRLDALKDLCVALTRAWAEFDVAGHPIEVGHAFMRDVLSANSLSRYSGRGQGEGSSAIAGNLPTKQNPHPNPLPEYRERGQRIPRLAALICCSPFDLALHDAFGNLHGLPVYETYNSTWMNRDLASYFDDAEFSGKYPHDFLAHDPPKKLAAWHLVGGLDPLTPDDLTGDEPDDGYPALLPDWIARDGLTCLKIKLRGNDWAWDLNRLMSVGNIALKHGVKHLSADFNCTVSEPQYVCDILDQLRAEHSEIFDRLLYVEQPFPYDLEQNRIDVRGVASRKPIFLDESAHDWRMIQLGQSLGWNGVALKTCKTQTGAILGLCWARVHGMQIMVQDLTNPMLAMIPHALLAANAGTIMGMETNACQFYPEASREEAKIHPGLFARRDGQIDLSSIHGSGFGYRLDEIDRKLSSPVATA